MLKDFIKKTNKQSYRSTPNVDIKKDSEDKEPQIPDGAWIKCKKCKKTVFYDSVKENFSCCPNCNYHFRIGAYERIRLLVDRDSFVELDKDVVSQNVLEFPEYDKKMDSLRESLDIKEAVVTGYCTIRGVKVVLCVMDNAFLMGSMGQVVGEKITRAVERATKEKLSVIICTTSGGARMQEGMVSLMQMAKVSAALKRHSNEHLLYITVLTDPTTGGVTASFAMLGDIILAEPEALVGFAGPRVIEQTIGQKLPEGFQRSEFLLEKGFVDRIVPRKYMRKMIGRILRMHSKNYIRKVPERQPETRIATFSKEEVSAWDRVLLARKSDRPTTLEYINTLFSKFIEFHGDRRYADDPAIVGGIAYFNEMPVTVIGHQKGRTTKENIKRNFGMPNPEGYRKAKRLMKQAEKFGRPIICFVDTAGAYCGMGAEERGQGEAIAANLFTMSDITVPIVSIIIGEGGSGGALALAVANEVWMLENSTYSVLSPEGFASILWKDSARAKEAAEVMKVTAKELKHLGIIEEVIREPVEISQEFYAVTEELQQLLTNFLDSHRKMSKEEIIEERYQKYRKFYGKE